MKRFRPSRFLDSMLAYAVGAVVFGAASSSAQIPEVEIQRLENELAGEVAPENRRVAQIQLAEAQLAADQTDAALATLGEGDDAPFLRARILMKLERWDDALQWFQKVGGAEEVAVKLAKAETLRQVGRTAEAVAVLEAVPDAPVVGRLKLAELYLESDRAKDAVAVLGKVEPKSGFERAWLAYLKGREALAAGDFQRADANFAVALADLEAISPGIYSGAALGASEAREQLAGTDAAAAMIEEFIRQNPDGPLLEGFFAKLDKLYAKRDRTPDTPLANWAGEKGSRRAALAAFYRARGYLRTGESDAALAALAGLDESEAPSGIALSALKLRARSLIERGEPADEVLQRAMRIATEPTELGRVEMLSGAAQFQKGDFLQAAIGFHNAAEHAPELREQAVFNAALAWLNQGNDDRFLQEYAAMSAEFPESDLRRELILEQGLVQARKGDKRAEATLKRFLKDFPESDRAPEAQVALAELAFLREPPDREIAARYLKVANDAPTDQATREQAEFLAVYLEQDSASAIAKALSFLEAHPESTLVPKVRMKLGELYSGTGDLANARTQFETLAAAAPDTEYAEAALFLAGQAAAKSMNPDRALELFEEVARRGGPFALYARQEQAALKSRLGQEKEAIILYEAILAGDPPPELRYAATMGKGDNLFLLGVADPANYEAAAETFRTIAELPEVPAPWRNQALYKQAKTLEKLDRQDAALAVLASVLEPATASSSVPDNIWIYRAGFDAARILESRERWESAAEIYRSIAALGGPRSQEAQRLLTQLRLEHFIWEQ